MPKKEQPMQAQEYVESIDGGAVAIITMLNVTKEFTAAWEAYMNGKEKNGLKTFTKAIEAMPAFMGQTRLVQRFKNDEFSCFNKVGNNVSFDFNLYD
jgi:hypothetical protein